MLSCNTSLVAVTADSMAEMLAVVTVAVLVVSRAVHSAESTVVERAGQKDMK